jgi:hypothetical protein
MAETLTAADWQALAKVPAPQLRALVARQLSLTTRALSALSLPPAAAAQLVQQAQADLVRGDTAAGTAQREAYNAAFSKARWALDDLAGPLRAAGQAALFEQANAEARGLLPAGSTPPPASPPKPAPAADGSAPPAAPPGGGQELIARPNTAKGREQQAVILKLAALDPTELRCLAQLQRDRLDARWREIGGWLRRYNPRWSHYEKAVADIDATLRRGDEVFITDAKTARRRATDYATALIQSRDIAENLDRDANDGNSIVVFIGGALDAAEKAATAAAQVVTDTAKEIKNTAAEAAKEAGSALRTGAYLVFGALAVGLGAAAFTRLGGGSSSSSSKRARRDVW